MKSNKIVDDLIIKDKDLFKEHVKRIAKSIIYELPYIRYYAYNLSLLPSL